MEKYHDDQIQASAIRFLLEGQQEDAAKVLLSCIFETEFLYKDFEDDLLFRASLTGPRKAYEILRDEQQTITRAVHYAVCAVLPLHYYIQEFFARAELVTPGPSWQAELLESINGKAGLNQCLPIDDRPMFPWKHLRFRAPHEISIAQALNEHRVLFLPNCMARLGSQNPQEQQNKEADFIVCFDGKWGILEVDGDTYHTSAARDHRRDRIFQSYGISVIQRFDTEECRDPKGVVKKFLELLSKHG